MHERRTFLQSGLGVVALAAVGGSISEAMAEEKPSIGIPKVVNGSDGTKVWAMGVMVTVKVKSEDTG